MLSSLQASQPRMRDSITNRSESFVSALSRLDNVRPYLMCTWDSFPAGKAAGAPASSADVKNPWIYTPNPFSALCRFE